MSRCLNLLLLICFINYIESSPRCVTGEQGGCITLSCEFKDRNIYDIGLSRFSKIIPIYPNEEDGRIFKNGSCDVIIKDLRFSDAGKYILSVYYKNDQTEVQRHTLEYQLDIHEKVDTDEEQRTVASRIIVVSVSVTLLVLLVLVISALIWKHRRQNRNTEHESVPVEDIQESRSSRDDTDFL